MAKGTRKMGQINTLSLLLFAARLGLPVQAEKPFYEVLEFRLRTEAR